MQIYDLDINEDFDILKVWDREYKVGDVPIWIYDKIQKMSTRFSSDKNFIKKWREVIIEYLKIKNKVVEENKISTKHIMKMIEIISNKIKKQDDYKR